MSTPAPTRDECISAIAQVLVDELAEYQQKERDGQHDEAA